MNSTKLTMPPWNSKSWLFWVRSSVMLIFSPALRKASSRRRWLSVSNWKSVVSKMVGSGLNHTVVPRLSVVPISVTCCWGMPRAYFCS